MVEIHGIPSSPNTAVQDSRFESQRLEPPTKDHGRDHNHGRQEMRHHVAVVDPIPAMTSPGRSEGGESDTMNNPAVPQRHVPSPGLDEGREIQTAQLVDLDLDARLPPPSVGRPALQEACPRHARVALLDVSAFDQANPTWLNPRLYAGRRSIHPWAQRHLKSRIAPRSKAATTPAAAHSRGRIWPVQRPTTAHTGTLLSLRVVCTRLPRGIQNLGYLTLGINLSHFVGQHRLLLSAGRRIQLHGAGEATVGEP